MNDNDYVEFENRTYVSPTVSRDEQLEYIDKLRKIQEQEIGGINQTTKNLGTDVPSIEGGLTGSEAIFEQRYVKPQTESLAANLRSVAQQTALNQALSNLQSQYQQRYNESYRVARIKDSEERKRRQALADAANRAALSSPTTTYVTPEGEVEFTSTGNSEQLNVTENELAMVAPKTTDVGAANAVNSMAAITGQGQLPTTSSFPAILVDKNGNRSTFTVIRGGGIETPYQSFNKRGAVEYLQNWVRQGGKVLTSNGKENDLAVNLLAWDLY